MVCLNWKSDCFALFLYILFDYVTVLFGDCQIAEKILKTKDPRKIKSLGRKVKGFTDEVWDDNCLQIVRLGNVCKVRYLILRIEVFPTCLAHLNQRLKFDLIVYANRKF